MTETTPGIPTPLPTDRWELTSVLLGLHGQDGRWAEVERRLREQIGDEAKALGVFEEAERDALHFLAIRSHRNDLCRALDDAAAGIRSALNALDVLTSESVYDVEYAEGVDAADMRAFLADAARALRAAAALNPGED